jgi:Ran GTPase-activating protein (RanGAP) involved in mRNA processing and transport
VGLLLADGQTLDLWGNGIGDDGAKAFAEGLQHCHSLQTLGLWKNGIGDDGAKALAEGLQYC